MTSKTDQIKEKLRSILSHVRNNKNEFERNAAMGRLQALLIKHRLDMNDIEDKAKEDIVEITVLGHNGPWARSVAKSISKLNFCNYVFQRKHGDQRFVNHSFVGRPHEVEVAKELTTLIHEQLLSESSAQARRSMDPSFQRSFLNAASATIYRRVEELIKQTSQPSAETSSSTALIVLNAYALAEVENNNFLEVAYPNLKTTKSRAKSKSHAGYAEGRAFGDKIPLNLYKKIA